MIFSAKAFAGEKVVIDMDDESAPYSYLENGELKGIYVDLFKQIAAKLAPAYDLQLNATPWNRGIRNLELGRSLALFPAYRNSERSFVKAYSSSVYQETLVIFCNSSVKNRNLKQFPEDFSGLRIGVNLGMILGEKMAVATKKKIFTIVESKVTEENLLKLYDKQIDCYVNERMIIDYSVEKLRKNPRFHQPKDSELFEAAVISLEDSVIAYSSTYAIAYKEDFIAKMNATIESAKKSGLIDRVIANKSP